MNAKLLEAAGAKASTILQQTGITEKQRKTLVCAKIKSVPVVQRIE